VTGAGRALTTLAAALAASAVVHAQQKPVRVSAAIESGAAVLEQPLVRSGAVYYLAPSAALQLRDLQLGSDAVFATGTPIWQSFLGSAWVRSPALFNVRLVSSAQVLRTSGLINTWHADVGGEWRLASATTTLVTRGRYGRLRFLDTWWTDSDVGATLTHTHGAMVLALDAAVADARRPSLLEEQLGIQTNTFDSFAAQTVDLTPRMIWERGRLRTDASLSIRTVQRGIAGEQIGGQLALTFAARTGLSLFLGAVQRLPDIRTGIPSGRTALLGLRLTGARLLHVQTPQRAPGPTLEVIGGALLLTVDGSGATRASLRGDFTDWQVRDCEPASTRQFRCGSAPAAGTWRVAVRLDDGAWRQPVNLAAASDDFGSVDGVLMTGGKP
jgi:hypothetical protein